MIRLDSVTKSFDIGGEMLTILHKTTFTIKKGEYVTIVGPSGSGKSSMMYLLGLLDSPTSGTVYINDVNTSHLTDEQISHMRNETIGFVFQQFNLINKLTVFENVLLPSMYATKKDIDYRSRTQELLERFGIQHRKDSYPNKISGGEQQRVAIARALLLNPEIILADEPTGNLDSKNGAIILNYIDELHKKDKKTIVIITHDPKIARHSQKTLHIKDGKIK